MNALRTLAAAALVCLCAARLPAAADVIISPTAVLGNTGGNFGGGYEIGNTINQSGLSTGFVSGVDDFDVYLAGSPSHTFIASGFEWFTPLDVTSSTITYDLGAEYTLTRLALWNEEFSGIADMSVATSNDPLFGTSTAVGAFSPTDSPFDTVYLAQVFALTPTSARYVRLEVSGPNTPSLGNYVSMGEIAFATGAATVVPEPSALALLVGAGLAGAGVLMRRRRA